MDKAKKGSLPMLSGKILSKAQCPATTKDREAMSNMPYALAIGSIMYAMLSTRPNMSNALSLMSDVYAHVCSCRQCWASKCRGL
jgi:ATP-binding cassette subfamily B (MDR/TAP) protein 1